MIQRKSLCHICKHYGVSSNHGKFSLDLDGAIFSCFSSFYLTCFDSAGKLDSVKACCLYIHAVLQTILTNTSKSSKKGIADI